MNVVVTKDIKLITKQPFDRMFWKIKSPGILIKCKFHNIWAKSKKGTEKVTLLVVF